MNAEMKKCIIVVNTYKTESTRLGDEIKEYLSQKGIFADIFLFNGMSDEYPFAGYDFVITLGGDGTVLFAARGCAPLDIPIFPVNFGQFGFIASVQKNEWQERLDEYLEGKSFIAERSLVQASILRKEQLRLVTSGLNEVFVGAGASAQMVSLDIAFNDVSLGVFKADGVVVSTATGSTAYSAAAGGPIVDPDIDALVLTPVNSFSLSARPLVLSSKGVLTIKILPSRCPNSMITVDGQIPVDLYVGDCIKICTQVEKARLIGCNPKNFYGALRAKLNWSGGPLA